MRDELQRAAELDLGDHIVFRIGPARRELQGAPGGGATYPVAAAIAGKRCAAFHIDVGFGDATSGEADVLIGDDLLAFAGVPPATVRSISTAQQFAEKIHAYTIEWKGRGNSRVKDLVDLVVLIDRGHLEVDSTRRAIDATFAARNTHSVPNTLREPPTSWVEEFRTLAGEAQLESDDLQSAYSTLSAFWSALHVH